MQFEIELIMSKLVTGYRKISRYSTLTLLAFTIGLGLYTWLTRSQVFYQSYCEEPGGTVFGELYKSVYECDQQLVRYRLEKKGQCAKIGCRRIVQ